MLIVVKLDGTRRYLPYYRNMRVGQFVTQIAAPALGCAGSGGRPAGIKKRKA